jgi:protein involved in polysaccharide export with SLBB domain
MLLELAVIGALDISTLAGASTSIAPEPPLPVPAIEQIDPAEYVLGPGDVLWLCAEGGLPSGFFPSAGASVVYLTVAPDGNVIIPLVGAVAAGDLTLEQASGTICSRVSSRFRGVQISVGLAGVRSFRVPVTGNVVLPGIVTVYGTDRLSDVIKAAGGTCPGSALSSIVIVSGEADTILVDLSRFQAAGDLDCNPLLSSGDRVHVPMATAFVEVQGALFLKGPFALGQQETGWQEGAIGLTEFRQGESVADCILRLGGLTPWAIRDSIYVERIVPGGVEIVPAPGPSTDVYLAAGDRIICPGSPATVSVTGFVEAPGPIAWVAGRDAFYYIAQAGGFAPEARQSGTRVVLPSGEEIPADEAGPLPGGSVVSVPRKFLMWWQDYLTIATGVATVVIAWKSVF